MEKDPLKKYETEPSAIPRQSVKSLSQLPEQKRSSVKLLFGLVILVIILLVLWLVIK